MTGGMSDGRNAGDAGELAEGKRWEGGREREREKERMRESGGRFRVYVEERVPERSILSLSACSRKPAP